ncbi:invasion associated locus B family protein [Xanthobacter sp. KR7-65]|uniref:invasion associated locus B family protein n=1 Tax=Xanthobacter sp. KR7-65 TaxID=3156612 RepID=UPI0032B5E31C
MWGMRPEDESSPAPATGDATLGASGAGGGWACIRHRIVGGVLAAALTAGMIGLAGKPAAAQTAPTFPGGAQSVSESFQDWRVACAVQQNAKRCSISQQQVDSKTRQRILMLELQPKGDKVEGPLFLPFGLFLEKGVVLKLGEADLAALRFSTCLPQGCVVPVSLDPRMLGLVRKADALRVVAANDAGQPQAFSISLKGFGQALDRAITLLR